MFKLKKKLIYDAYIIYKTWVYKSNYKYYMINTKFDVHIKNNKSIPSNFKI